jgi:hypothetical protein
MGRDLKHMHVLNVRYFPRSQRVHVWPTIFGLDSKTFRQMKKKPKDRSVERADKVSIVILWSFWVDEENVKIAPMDEEG